MQVAAYFAAFWPTDPSTLAFERLDRLYYAFVIPTREGTLTGLDDTKLATLSQGCQAHQCELYLALGGWDLGDGGGVDHRFVELAQNQSALDRLADELILQCQRHQAAGVDVDWEFPNSEEKTPLFEHFVCHLKARLAPHGLKVTAAVNASEALGQFISSRTLSQLDGLNIMAYDNGPNNHSDLPFASEALNYWCDRRGYAKSKTYLGLPFYGRRGADWDQAEALTLKELVAKGANIEQSTFDGFYYNGLDVLQQKMDLAKLYGCHLMIWEISQDHQGKLLDYLTSSH